MSESRAMTARFKELAKNIHQFKRWNRKLDRVLARYDDLINAVDELAEYIQEQEQANQSLMDALDVLNDTLQQTDTYLYRVAQKRDIRLYRVNQSLVAMSDLAKQENNQRIMNLKLDTWQKKRYATDDYRSTDPEFDELNDGFEAQMHKKGIK